MSSCLNGKESSRVNTMPYLPDDLLLNCLARVSRLYYQNLSLVSKRFRSLIASTELYETRRLLDSTESCLYACLKLPQTSTSLWFTHYRGPTRIPKWPSSPFFPCTTSTKRIRNLLISVPSYEFSHPLFWKHASIGSNIYMIGGYISSSPSSRVFFMDCRSHTWHEAPSMLVTRMNPMVSVVDGKIYVVDGLPNYNYSDFMEVFDPKTQRWEHAPNPSAEIRGKRIDRCLAKEGNLYLFGDKDLVYKPKENKWDTVGILEMRFNIVSGSCIIDNVEFRYTSGYLKPKALVWYDSEERYWKVLKGLEDDLNLLDISRDTVRLVNYGGNLAVFWERTVFAVGPIRRKKILCVEIEIERCNGQGIRGKVKWCDAVLEVPESYKLEQLIFATV